MMKVIALIISIFFCSSLTYSKVNTDQYLNRTSHNDTYFINNSAQCAAEMKRPAQSFFILNNLLPYGILLNNLQIKLNYKDDNFIISGVKYHNQKLIYLSQLIIDKLITKQIPYVKNIDDALLYQSHFNIQENSKKNLKTECHLVNDITNQSPQIYLRAVDKATLEKLAKIELSHQDSQKCEDKIMTSSFDLYPIFNFNFKHLTSKDWDENGFAFWDSFKIYLSLYWKKHNISFLKNDIYEKLSLMIPLEDLIILNSDSCASINRPECKSDFLSSTEIRTLFSQQRTHLKMTDNSLQMKENIFYTNYKMEENIQHQLEYNNSENSLIQNLLNSLLGFKNQNTESLNRLVEVFSAILSTHNENKLVEDLQFELQQKKDFEELHYMCSEIRLLKQGFFKIEDELLESNLTFFDQHIKTTYKPSMAVNSFKNISQKVIKFCDQVDQIQIKNNIQINSSWSDYKTWYIDFLKSYKSFKQDIESETSQNSINYLQPIRDNYYVNGLCNSAANCLREMIESMASLNKIVLHKKTFFPQQITAGNLFNENAEKVACNIYDPFEISKNNQKKLIYDIAGSAFFGYSALPIFFDVNFNPKEVKSFNKMIADKEIKFDVTMGESELKSSLALNFGALLDIPCAVSFSETAKDFMPLNSGYLFNGISVGACKSNKNEGRENISSKVDTFNTTGQSSSKSCFECTINFTTISTLKSLNIFSPIRFFIKLMDSLIRYENIKNSEFLNPTELKVNKKFLVQTYLKYKKTIPEECVNTLKLGLPCAKNFCAAMAIREYEKYTGQSVQEIDLISNNHYHSTKADSDTYSGAWIKNINSQQTHFRFVCQNSNKYFRATESALRNLK